MLFCRCFPLKEGSRALPQPLDAQSLAARRDKLLRQLASIGNLRPGSLLKSYRKCGKAGCRCADEQHPGHGPYWVLTWTAKGRTRNRSIPASQVECAKAQIAECQRL